LHVANRMRGADGFNCCYKPSVFQPSKMFGFDFETYLIDMTVNGNLQLACLA